MKVARFVLAMMLIGAAPTIPALAAEERDTVKFREAAPDDPARSPSLDEERKVRPGGVVYTERATGLPGARLTESLTLKNTPAGNRVTIDPDDDLQKHYVDDVPWFCAHIPVELYSRPPGRARRNPMVREAGFYICLRDGDGDAGTFEKVRILTHIEKIVDRDYSAKGGAVQKMNWFYEDTASGTVSPRKFVKTTVDPDNGDYYEAVITLTEIDDGKAEFRAELLDKEGDRELRPKEMTVDLSGPFPVTVTVPHPFEGDLVYRTAEKSTENERAARLEILAVEGDVVTYRVVRGFKPWRYWSEGPARRPVRRLRWRQRH